MRVLVFGTYDTSMHPRIATIAEGLAANGPRRRGVQCPARPVDGGPGQHAGPAVARPDAGWQAGEPLDHADRAVPAQPAPDVVVVGYLGHFDVVLARFLFRLRGALRRRKIPIVLDHLVGASDTGRDRRLDGGPRQALLRMIDAAALGSADVIVVDTDEHLANLPPQHRDHAIVVHVGAPAAWYEAARATDERVTGEEATSTKCPPTGVPPRSVLPRVSTRPVAGGVLRPVHPVAGNADDRRRAGG